MWAVRWTGYAGWLHCLWWWREYFRRPSGYTLNMQNIMSLMMSYGLFYTVYMQNLKLRQRYRLMHINRNSRTKWSHWVEERKKKQENSLITGKINRKGTIPSSCLSSYGAVQRFMDWWLPSFFPRSNENKERCGPLTCHCRKCGTFSESQRNPTGGYNFVFWLKSGCFCWLDSWLTTGLARWLDDY